MFTGIFITASVIGYFYPYPSSGAYVNTVNTLFTLMFFAFDIGTAGIMDRFIPEARIKDPMRMLYYIFMYLPLMAQYGFIIAVIPFIIIMIIVAIFGYYPLTALLGGWDDASIAEFANVVKISGPSKGIVRPMYDMIKKCAKKSPLHNRFILDDEAAFRESKELDRMRAENASKLVGTL